MQQFDPPSPTSRPSDGATQQPSTTQTSPPGRRLTRRGLTLLLLLVAATPVAAVLYLWQTLPPVEQHPLHAVLEQIDAAAAPPSAKPASRVVRFRNAGDQVWSNVAVSLNERFHFHRPGTVAPGEAVELPLAQFALRSGGSFDPSAIEVTSVEIMARLPSGTRAIFEAEAPFETAWDGQEGSARRAAKPRESDERTGRPEGAPAGTD